MNLEDYPNYLNPFKEDYPDQLNPFSDEFDQTKSTAGNVSPENQKQHLSSFEPPPIPLPRTKKKKNKNKQQQK